MRTQDSLGIFWKGEEADGVLFYGFWAGSQPTAPAFPATLWPPDAEVRTRRLWGESWTVWMWEVHLPSWPPKENWVGVVTDTLAACLPAGAAVAWCAAEGCFVEPPHLFDPKVMKDGVWACRSRGGVSWPPPALEAEFVYVAEGILAQLHSEILGKVETPPG